MTKGTTSMGRRNGRTHTLCRRCGARAWHIGQHFCGACAYPSARGRKFNWSEKAMRRKAQGTGRLRHVKVVNRRFNHNFRHGPSQ